MPFLHGALTKVLLDGADVSAWLKAINLNGNVDPADVTTFGDMWKSFIPGAASATLEADGFHDVNMQNFRALLATGADSVLTYTPGGVSAFGDPARLLASLTSKYNESMPVGDAVGFKWGVTADDQVGYGQLMHLLAAETVTGTSTFLDGGAQTLNGAIAHLHVTAIAGTGSPSVTVKFQDATTSGGVYADIAGGAFTLQNVVGGQRLVIPGTIRQFVKCIWTIAGTGPSITFAVAFARR